MEIREITLERKGEGGQCGTLAFRDENRTGWLLFMVQWHRGQRAVVEFLPGLGAHQADIAANQGFLIDSVVQAVFERISRKTIFL